MAWYLTVRDTTWKMGLGKKKMEGFQTGTWGRGTDIQNIMTLGLMALSRLLSLREGGKPQMAEKALKAQAARQCEFDVQARKYHTLAFDRAIDLASAPRVRKRLLSALGAHRHLVIDFTHLPYIDSAGIAVFLEGLKIAKYQGYSMVFVGVQGPALQLMELTRLNQVFTLLSSHP